MVRIRKASTLLEVRKLCRPFPLSGDELESFFIETDKGRNRYQSTRKLLVNELKNTEGDATKILFYGHKGCGKSTELNKFIQECKNEFFPVQLSLADHVPLVAIHAEDLILIITDCILKEVKDAGLDIDETLLEPVLDYFSATKVEEISNRAAGLLGIVGIDTKSSLIGKLAGIYANLTAEIKYDTHRKSTTVSALRKRPMDLLIQANAVIDAVRKALPVGKRILVIIEDLDKLDLKQAHDIYVNHTNLLTGINTNIIYTIPVFLFHSPDVDSFKYLFNAVITQPMIMVTEPPHINAAGFDVVKEIIYSRLEKDVIEDSAMAMLIEKTGGVLRHVFEVLHTASVMNDIELPIKNMHIRYGLDKLATDFSNKIADPDEKKTTDELYDRLQEYAENQRDGKKTTPKSDYINQLLLKTCALVQYNGKGWLGVHPLVIENLKELGRL